MYEVSITLKDDLVTNRYFFNSKNEVIEKRFSQTITDGILLVFDDALSRGNVFCAYELSDGTYITCRRVK